MNDQTKIAEMKVNTAKVDLGEIDFADLELKTMADLLHPYQRDTINRIMADAGRRRSDAISTAMFEALANLGGQGIVFSPDMIFPPAVDDRFVRCFEGLENIGASGGVVFIDEYSFLPEPTPLMQSTVIGEADFETDGDMEALLTVGKAVDTYVSGLTRDAQPILVFNDQRNNSRVNIVFESDFDLQKTIEVLSDLRDQVPALRNEQNAKRQAEDQAEADRALATKQAFYDHFMQAAPAPTAADNSAGAAPPADAVATGLDSSAGKDLSGRHTPAPDATVPKLTTPLTAEQIANLHRLASALVYPPIPVDPSISYAMKDSRFLFLKDMWQGAVPDLVCAAGLLGYISYLKTIPYDTESWNDYVERLSGLSGRQNQDAWSYLFGIEGAKGLDHLQLAERVAKLVRQAEGR
jgi:hypothetical protein